MRYFGLIIIIAIAFTVIAFAFRDTENGTPTLKEGINAINRANTFIENLQDRNNE